MLKILVTGSSGLIGSEVVTFFCNLNWDVYGVDNNMRANFFGPEGDTRWNQRRLLQTFKQFTYHDTDIRNRDAIASHVKGIRPNLIVHTAAQPSHDLAASRPFDDFDVNAVGTLNLLEASRQYAPEAVFVHLSTNKVYGDNPNKLPIHELSTRWEYSNTSDYNGIKETMSIDHSKHSLFGASKLAADVLVQEYGRYFDLRTCCLRGGCLTGPNHSGVELHGFLNYLIRCNIEGRVYKIFGYNGKQVRENIHSYDVARFIEEFWKQPKCGETYNIGGGRANSVSIIEAFELIRSITGKKQIFEYVEANREGDHICYISDLSKCRAQYPNWNITVSLQEIFRSVHEGIRAR